MSGFFKLVRRFGKDESGVFAVIFGVMAIVLVALGGAVVDYVSLEQTRGRAQTALDAAVLALQPEINKSGMSEASIREKAEAIVRERIGDARVKADVSDIAIDLETGRLYLGGNFSMPTIFVSLVGVKELGGVFSAEAARGSLDLEVSIALDITGSMGGKAIADLRSSVADLVDAIVKDEQTPHYSKVALVPYAQAVNAGAYADALRGPIRGPKELVSASWANGNTLAITNATRANNRSRVQISSRGHGLRDGDWVYIWDVQGMTQINSKPFMVTDRTNDTFGLAGTETGSFSNYSRNGNVVRCNVSNCDLVITSPDHGYSNGENIYVTDMPNTGINNRGFSISGVTRNTLVLTGLPIGGGGSFPPNTGKLHCTWQNAVEGCSFYRFTNANRAIQHLAATTCVTDRAINGFTDLPPSTTLAGRNYPPVGTCPGAALIPLTADKAELHRVINTLSANGTTAGNLGILWSWYTLSPNFGSAWPGSMPAAYNAPHLLKAAVLMTDGDFNTVHCEGVVSRSSSIVAAASRINCDAPNGESYAQSQRYCDAMKAAGISIYTVAFNLRAGTAAANIMAYCASVPRNAYLAQDGTQLRDAFQQIARDISALRLTQ